MIGSGELFEKAKVHIDRDEFPQAQAALIEHLNDHFFDHVALMMLGHCYIVQGHFGLGAVLTKQAIQAQPDFAEAWRNLGVTFKATRQNAQAYKAFTEALRHEKLPQERAKVYGSLGTCFVNEGDPQKALGYFAEANKLSPDNPVLIYNESLALLEAEQWGPGFKGYEARFAAGAQLNVRKYGKLPVWDGTPDQTVIVWGEQGIGDEILFATCLPDMIARCHKVILDCHPRLVNLFKRSFPDVEIHGTRKQMSSLPWFEGLGVKPDAHISISSLPAHFRKSREDFTGKPFLIPDRSAAVKGTRPNIGLSWRGGTPKTRSDLRSMDLMDMLPILKAFPEADFYSLQYTPESAKEVCALEEQTGIRIKHYPGFVQAKDYDVTAGFVAAMDLVITVCTAIHHLAGGLGVPTWTLVPSKPAWRYGLTGETCPWYSSVRYFRQAEDGKWGPVIERVAAELPGRFATLSEAAD